VPTRILAPISISRLSSPGDLSIRGQHVASHVNCVGNKMEPLVRSTGPKPTSHYPVNAVISSVCQYWFLIFPLYEDVHLVGQSLSHKNYALYPSGIAQPTSTARRHRNEPRTAPARNGVVLRWTGILIDRRLDVCPSTCTPCLLISATYSSCRS